MSSAQSSCGIVDTPVSRQWYGRQMTNERRDEPPTDRAEPLRRSAPVTGRFPNQFGTGYRDDTVVTTM
ncbi:hypothetical protein HSBGL_2299 [Halapricum desulfuricans]|uniref:Uncharacterized protein n=1 Tax=Halapricum desulfuricans TaxID=2841257 RepID=A0A897NMK1_9EURY|nr:hypothetical protein HSBGL_2299 [Halapricum desulfuricans]